MRVETHPYTYQWYQINQSVTHDSLIWTKSAFKKNSNISHFSGDFMGNYAESYREKLIGISEIESNANRKSINEIME